LSAAPGAVAAAAAATAMAPEVNPQDAPASSTFRALAWSDADDVPDVAPTDPYDYGGETNGGVTDARPPDAVRSRTLRVRGGSGAAAWYRRPAIILGAGVVALLAALVAAVLFVMRSDSTPTPASTTAPTTNAPPPTSAAPIPAEAPAPPPQTQAPQTRTVTRQAPPPPAVRGAPAAATAVRGAPAATRHGGAPADRLRRRRPRSRHRGARRRHTRRSPACRGFRCRGSTRSAIGIALADLGTFADVLPGEPAAAGEHDRI